MKNTSKPDFKGAAEAPKKKRTRLEAQAKALDEMLRTPSTRKMSLTPMGSLRRQGDGLARQAVIKRRVDVSKEIEALKTANRKKAQSKSRSR